METYEIVIVNSKFL